MGLLLDPHLQVGGHNFVLVVSFLLAALYCAHLIRLERSKYNTVIEIFLNRSLRFIMGFGIMALGVVIRIGGWIPWRPYLYAGDLSGAEAYKAFSVLWTGAGEVLAVTGLVLIAWPLLRSLLGKYAVVWVILMTVACFFVGAWITQLLSLVL